VDFRK
jgi:transposase